MNRNCNRLTVVLGLFGRYERLVNDFGRKVNELKMLGEDVEIIIVADGREWAYSPMYQMLPINLSAAKLVLIDQCTDLPAKVFNLGLQNATGDFITFFHLLGDDIKSTTDYFFDYEEDENKENNVEYIRNYNSHINGVHLSEQNRYGFLQVQNFLQLNELFIRTTFLKKINGFNESPLLQRDFDRELMLRLAMNSSFYEIGTWTRNINTFFQYPFQQILKIEQDIVDRYIVRNSRPAFGNQNFSEVNQSFVNDLQEHEQVKFTALTGIKTEHSLKFSNKYKILVLGGYWEYHHNQICFYNYFENLAGEGFCTYKSGFDFMTKEHELEEYDLVVFVRCRSDNAVSLINFCNKRNIPSIYMIDDNWISIANDFPEQGQIFKEGNPNYDNFIEAIGKCKTTWLFNDKLEEDVKPYAKHITKFYISIEPRLFINENIRKKSNEIYVGFSGSLRFDNTAFRALSRIAKDYDNVCTVLVGVLSKEQRELFKDVKVKELGFESYSIYAKHVSELSIDLLIAPLTKNRTVISKCYNKYVESAITHSACVYSNIEPYTLVVENDQNGYYVDIETEDGWYDKIVEILSDVPKLRMVQENAFNDVIENHSVKALLSKFIDNIEQIIEKEEPRDV